MQFANPIARITAAVILILSILSVIGLIGNASDLSEDAFTTLGVLIGGASTYLFVATKQNQQ